MRGRTGTNYGNYVVVRSNITGTSKDYYFAHLGRIDSSITNSYTPIDRGDRLGQMGSTGNSTGPHLHYEMINNLVDYDESLTLGIRSVVPQPNILINESIAIDCSSQ